MGITGPLIGSGRTADVFALDDAWVLRRYRGWGDAAREAVVMAYLHEKGYPVPQVREEGATRSDLVMQRLSGPTLAEAGMRGSITPEDAGLLLARLLRDLHAIPARASAVAADHRVLHLDLHPENVILAPSGPMVIDWSNTEEGPPGLDWAMSALILAEVAVGDRAESGMVRAALAGLLSDIPAGLRLTADGHLAAARARRATNPTLSAAEVRRLGEAVDAVVELG
ncbi:phosphotransferase [Streptomyces sp. NPDC086554]|uniref:phosphotransferase n=1 Tax=Streptomyces sp. NPDC086554 TaxID=3154864 RepID=UPI00343126B2